MVRQVPLHDDAATDHHPTVLRFPADIRPLADFSMEFPAAWTLTEFPGCLICASTAEEGDPTRWLNLFVAHERITIRSHETVFGQRGVALQAEGIGIESEQSLEMDETWLVRTTQYTDAAMGQELRRVDLSTTGPNPGVFLTDDLVTLSFLAPASVLDDFEEDCNAIMRSFSFA